MSKFGVIRQIIFSKDVILYIPKGREIMMVHEKNKIDNNLKPYLIQGIDTLYNDGIINEVNASAIPIHKTTPEIDMRMFG